MARASVTLLAWTLAVIAACKGEPFRPDAQIDAPTDAFDPPWWTPAPGELMKNWDIQLEPPFMLSAARSMYMLDLWDVSDTRMIDYGDGTPVAVPAGPLTGMIAALHARDPRPVVICVVNTGAVHLTKEPDAVKLPGYEASPPNRPTPVETGSVIGWDTGRGDPDERFLDIRAASRPLWTDRMWKRLDLAKLLGCDGVASTNSSVSGARPRPTGSGFDFTGVSADQDTWFSEVAMQAHQRELSVGWFSNAELELDGQIDTTARTYDWMVAERCAESNQCGLTRPYVERNNAVLAIDYMGALSEPLACSRYLMGNIEDGLFKDPALSSAYFSVCP